MRKHPAFLTSLLLLALPIAICSADEMRLSVPPGVEPSLAIDLFVADAWRAEGIAPSRRCDDEAFVRRLYLDLVGRIPTLQEAEEFRLDTGSDKRERLIDRLIDAPEFAAHLTNVFDAFLMGRKGRETIRQRERHGWRPYLYEAFLQNRPWNKMTRDMTLARATDETDVRASWYLYERKNDYQQIAEAVSANLFGVRIECAQCHDHPLASEIQQYHYWGMVKFFGRGKNQQSKNGPRVLESAVGGHYSFKDLAGDDYQAELTIFESNTISEPALSEDAEKKDADENYVTTEADLQGEPKVPKFSRRQRFADEILAEHPLVAQAFVNRMWALLMGRGLIHPVDRMDSMHPASHPELLEWLSDDFRSNGYNVKRLAGQLVRTRCYQLDSRPADNDALPQHFAYALDKPLMAESFLNSIEVVLTGESQSTHESLLERFRRDFPDVFAETANSTLAQALMLSNHPELNAMFRIDVAAIDQMLKQQTSAEDQVELAFRIVFNRKPEDDERAAAIEFLQQRDQRQEALGQLLWAMVTSAEFRMNH